MFYMHLAASPKVCLKWVVFYILFRGVFTLYFTPCFLPCFTSIFITHLSNLLYAFLLFPVVFWGFFCLELF